MCVFQKTFLISQSMLLLQVRKWAGSPGSQLLLSAVSLIWTGRPVCIFPFVQFHFGWLNQIKVVCFKVYWTFTFFEESLAKKDLWFRADGSGSQSIREGHQLVADDLYCCPAAVLYLHIACMYTDWVQSWEVRIGLRKLKAHISAEKIFPALSDVQI